MNRNNTPTRTGALRARHQPPRRLHTRPVPTVTAALTLLSALAACPAVRAQASDPAAIDAAAPAPSQIVIKGQALRTADTTYSSTVLDARQIRQQTVTQPEELLRLVPGVVVRSLSLGGVANSMTIRGFSSGGHGGDLGIVVDGIPLNEAMSHADGYADLNTIVPLEIERFEVFRGPVSALYGNFNRGGVLAVQTRWGGDYAEIDSSAGSFGTHDLQGVYGTRVGPGHINLAGQYHRTEGFRVGYGQTRGTLAARYGFDVGSATQLVLSGRMHRGDWDNLGNVSKAQFEGRDPYGADPRVVGDGGLKRYASLRADLSHRFSEQLQLLSFLYGNTQDLSRWFTRPVNATDWRQREETYDRRVVGGGFSLNGSANAAGVPLAFVAGVELYREDTDFEYFEGTTNRARVNAAVADRSYGLDSVGAFAEVQAAFTPALRGTLGLRHDRFSGDCKRNGAETTADPCEALNRSSRTTPKLGLRYAVTPQTAIRASVAEGFALPPGSVKYAPGGANVDPTVFRQVEVGASYSTGRVFTADIGVYRIDSRQEVRTVSPGVFENFGKTRREGFEAAFTLRPLGALELGLVYSETKATVRENSNPALVGKWVTGVPRRSGTLSAAWRPDLGWGASAELRHVGRHAVLADNSAFYPSYTTADLGLSYAGLLPEPLGGQHFRAYIKVENAGDKLYATSTGITSGQQTYNVAPPRGVRVGLQADF